MLKRSGGDHRFKETRPKNTVSKPSSYSASKHAPDKKQPDYEKLGRLLFAIGETGSKNRKKLYRIAFWKGVWGGLGGVIGATIVVSLLLWLFNVVGSVPLIGTFIDTVEQSIPSNNLD